MRAVVCDWCAAVTTSPGGWYEVTPTGTPSHSVFAESPRTFCGLDCLGDFIDDARTSPTGEVTGAAPVPATVDVGPVIPACRDSDVQIPAVEPDRTVPPRRPMSVVSPADALAAAPETEPAAEVGPAAPRETTLVAAPVEAAPLLRGLGRGLGRTGS